ncbi:hypothetical protein [Lysobacter fragariae]
MHRERQWLVAMLVMVAVALPAHADDIPYMHEPQLPAHAATPEGFVPSGWTVERSERRDFNRDGQEDVLLLLRQSAPAKASPGDGSSEPEAVANPRLLAAALADAERGGYALSFSDDSLIPDEGSPTASDPLGAGGLTATERGFALTIGFGGAGTRTTSRTTYTFRYQDNCFRLVGYDYGETDRATLATREVSVDYLARKVKDTSGSGNRDAGAQRVTWRRLPANQPLCIQSARSWDGLRPETLPRNSR